jgi:hypothetical protein
MPTWTLQRVPEWEDRVAAETPPPCKWSNGEQTPGRETKLEDPGLWDDWAIDMEYRIQDVRVYIGAIEKVLISKVEGLLNQAKAEKNFSTRDWHKCKGASQRRSRPESRNDWKSPGVPSDPSPRREAWQRWLRRSAGQRLRGLSPPAVREGCGVRGSDTGLRRGGPEAHPL